MTPQIRVIHASEAARAHALIREALPCLIITEEHLRWRLSHPLPGARDVRLVAVDGDTVVGHVLSRLQTAHDGTRTGRSLFVAVAEPYRGGGLPRRLLEASDARLVSEGATVLRAVSGQDGSTSFHRAAEELGYEPEGEAEVLGLDLGTLPDRVPAPEGFELLALSALADPRPVFELDRAADADEPGESSVAFMPYEEWLDAVWNNPLTDLDISMVMLHQGAPVSFSAYSSDRATRVGSAMTGTAREYRGRGLATRTKVAALHAARDRGATHAFTLNHVDNGPMLAINRRLGYTTFGVELTLVRKPG
ncbi:GNAT family N-acetyltransferase [Nocardiopsis sp. NPDC007018]|uniref:GNAT family N-acetyltransferase n=1 Tax=Nocardiopsis sp. NPDC007018 TaxID=3155721 RepID=UPI0033F8DE75